MCGLVCILLCAIFSIVAGAKSYSTTLLSLERCKVAAGGKEIYYTFEMKEYEGNKYVTANISLLEEVNEDWSFHGTVMVLNHKTYVKYLDIDGKVCDSISTAAELPFERFKESMEPSVKEYCKIPPNNYTVSYYWVGDKEVDMPIPTGGQYKIISHVSDSSNTERLCMQWEMLVKEDESSDEDADADMGGPSHHHKK